MLPVGTGTFIVHLVTHAFFLYLFIYMNVDLLVSGKVYT